MPRLTKSLPKYRRKKIRDVVHAVVTLNGKDVYLGGYGSKASKIEYDQLIGEWLANGRVMPVTERPITIVELIDQYWNFAEGYYVKNGKPTDELPGLRIALQVLKDNYGKNNVDEFGPLALVALRNKLVERGNSRKYVNQNIGRIKRCFCWGVAQELVPVDVHQRLETLVVRRNGMVAIVGNSWWPQPPSLENDSRLDDWFTGVAEVLCRWLPVFGLTVFQNGMPLFLPVAFQEPFQPQATDTRSRRITFHLAGPPKANGLN